MFFFNPAFYTVTIILQAICVIHCVRKRNQNNWIYLIIFLPVIGSLVYLFSEVITRRGIKNVQSGVEEVFRPSGSIKKLEETLRFSDTFNNRIALADAYMATGQTQRAIELYEDSLHGAFAENELGVSRLIIAYYKEKRYDDVIRMAQKIYKLPQFARSKAHILYAASLGNAGQNESAEKEFLKMNGRFGNFEARYYYALFLQRNNRYDEGRRILGQVTEEIPQLSSIERRSNREWLSLAKEAMKN
jgi:hypothetical protein